MAAMAAMETTSLTKFKEYFSSKNQKLYSISEAVIESAMNYNNLYFITSEERDNYLKIINDYAKTDPDKYMISMDITLSDLDGIERISNCGCCTEHDTEKEIDILTLQKCSIDDKIIVYNDTSDMGYDETKDYSYYSHDNFGSSDLYINSNTDIYSILIEIFNNIKNKLCIDKKEIIEVDEDYVDYIFENLDIDKIIELIKINIDKGIPDDCLDFYGNPTIKFFDDIIYSIYDKCVINSYNKQTLFDLNNNYIINSDNKLILKNPYYNFVYDNIELNMFKNIETILNYDDIESKVLYHSTDDYYSYGFKGIHRLVKVYALLNVSSFNK